MIVWYLMRCSFLCWWFVFRGCVCWFSGWVYVDALLFCLGGRLLLICCTLLLALFVGCSFDLRFMGLLNNVDFLILWLCLFMLFVLL